MTPTGYSIWKGAAVIGKYSIGQNSSIAVRGEVYDDSNGFTTGIIQTLKEIASYHFENNDFHIEMVWLLQGVYSSSNSYCPDDINSGI